MSKECSDTLQKLPGVPKQPLSCSFLFTFGGAMYGEGDSDVDPEPRDVDGSSRESLVDMLDGQQHPQYAYHVPPTQYITAQTMHEGTNDDVAHTESPFAFNVPATPHQRPGTSHQPPYASYQPHHPAAYTGAPQPVTVSYPHQRPLTSGFSEGTGPSTYRQVAGPPSSASYSRPATAGPVHTEPSPSYTYYPQQTYAQQYHHGMASHVQEQHRPQSSSIPHYAHRPQQVAGPSHGLGLPSSFPSAAYRPSPPELARPWEPLVGPPGSSQRSVRLFSPGQESSTAQPFRPSVQQQPLEGPSGYYQDHMPQPGMTSSFAYPSSSSAMPSNAMPIPSTLNRESPTRANYCEECQRQFQTRRQLNSHNQRQHGRGSQRQRTGQRVYCQYCQHGFARSDSLNRHLRKPTKQCTEELRRRLGGSSGQASGSGSRPSLVQSSSGSTLGAADSSSTTAEAIRSEPVVDAQDQQPLQRTGSAVFSHSPNTGALSSLTSSSAESASVSPGAPTSNTTQRPDHVRILSSPPHPFPPHPPRSPPQPPVA